MQTTTPTAAAPKPFKPRSRYRSLEFVLGALLTGVMVLLVLTSGWLFPDGGESMDLAARLMAPFSSAAHPFGTDPLGRDVLARVIVGGKISLMVGFASVLGGALLGIIMGLIAGYYRGFWDMIVMRFADVQLALPFILVAITFIAILGGGLFNVIFFMIVSQWVQYARLVRAQVLALREREFVLAARAFGVRDLAMIRHHIVPNLLGPLVILMTLNVANNIPVSYTHLTLPTKA